MNLQILQKLCWASLVLWPQAAHGAYWSYRPLPHTPSRHSNTFFTTLEGLEGIYSQTVFHSAQGLEKLLAEKGN